MPSRSFLPVKVNILSALGRYFNVPRYQRPYTWRPENIEALWDDMNESDTGEIFLGIIVLHDNGYIDEDSTNRIEIIDGQQRLTTITIFLSLLRNLYIYLGDTTGSKETQLAIEKSNALGSQGYTLKLSEKLQSFFEKYIQSTNSQHIELMDLAYAHLSEEEERIVRNYRKFHELLTDDSRWSEGTARQKTEFLGTLKKQILRAEVIEVTVTSEDDAYDLFETLNSRSVNLSEVNMIKNRVFMKLSPVRPIEELESEWDEIEQNSGGERRNPDDIQKFINYFWWSRYKKIAPKQIFRSLKHEDMAYMLKEILSDSLYYKKLRSQDSTQRLAYRRIDLNNIKQLSQLLNMQQVFIPLLSIVRKLEADDYWTKYNNSSIEPFINKLSKFLFAYKFSERSPAAVEKMYSNNAIKIFEARDKRTLIDAILEFEKELNKNFPTEEEFKTKFSQLRYQLGASANNKIIGYALEKIYYGDSNEVVINIADIEHVFPRNPEKGFSKSENAVKDLVNDLGNLTPLAELINRHKCQNKRPVDKAKYYLESKINENTELAKFIQNKGWDEFAIQHRTEKLVDAMWDYLNS